MAFLDKKIPNQHVCFTAFEGNYKVGLPSLPPAFILKDNNLFKLLHFFYAYVINLLKKKSRIDFKLWCQIWFNSEKLAGFGVELFCFNCSILLYSKNSLFGNTLKLSYYIKKIIHLKNLLMFDNCKKYESLKVSKTNV